uniref:V-SNARE coiled-coil homology domain-containing protein n=1 Tax=Geospiza parvula TaxID=87175 RepID=A0A8U8AYF8_GEOPR
MSAPSAPAAPPPAAGEGGGPPAPPPNLTSNRRLQQTQAQVDEVVDIMRVNVDKVLERDQKLSELDDPGGRAPGRRLPVRDQRGQAQAQVLVEEPQDDDHPGRDLRHRPHHHHRLFQHLTPPALPCQAPPLARAPPPPAPPPRTPKPRPQRRQGGVATPRPLPHPI